MGTFLKDQRGIGHVGIIVVIVAVLAAGGVGWWVWQKNKDKTPRQEAINSAVCNGDDKDICKFFAGWKATDNYSIEATSTVNDETTKAIIEVDGKDKTHVSFSGSLTYDTITIGNTLYTKAGDTWYKQTLSAEEVKNYQGDINTEFTEPTAGGKISYIKVGTEDCNDRKCFKYQVVDADTPDVTQYIWFDTKDFLLRRVQITSTDGTGSDMTVSYKKVSISEPSPVRELAEDQYIIPGQTEPSTLPGTGDGEDLNEQELQELLEQYQ